MNLPKLLYTILSLLILHSGLEKKQVSVEKDNKVDEGIWRDSESTFNYFQGL